MSLTSSRELDALLRARAEFAPDASAVPWRRLAMVIVVCGAIHGTVMATFGGLTLQLVISAVKLPMLITVSTLICLPSLFVVNTIAGLREDLGAVMRGILAAQATVAVTLVAVGPFLLLFYWSTPSYPATQFFNGFLFFVASLAGQKTLATHYRPLIHKNPRHRTGRRMWWFLYVLVTIQLAWVLRPFIGNPNIPVQIFREGAWGNAYVQIFELLTGR